MLESTTYPGTTREIVKPLLEEGSGLKAGEDFHLAMSPERVDPGRTDWTTKTTPKIVGGLTPACTEAAAEVYRGAIDTVHTVSTPEAAELTKLLENIFRSVNIALVNELAQLCDRMDIDVWEVVGAAATKPFGFMPFQPGPGPRRPLHPARPVLPLVEGARVRLLDAVHRARRRGQQQHAVLLPLGDLAGAEPRPADARVSGSRILLLGVAYKADIGDMRETPAEKLIELLRTAGAERLLPRPARARVRRDDLRRRSSPRPTTASRSSPRTRRSTTPTSCGARRSSSTSATRRSGHEAEGKVWKL